MTDSVLAESAQLRSALQAKTYLQALSPEERRRVLKGAKVPGETTRPCGLSFLTGLGSNRHTSGFIVQVIDVSITLLL